MLVLAHVLMRGINGDLYLVVADAVPLNGAVGAEHIAAERIDVLEDVRDFCAYLIIAAVEDDAAVVHAAENGLAAEELSALGEGEAGVLDGPVGDSTGVFGVAGGVET